MPGKDKSSSSMPEKDILFDADFKIPYGYEMQLGRGYHLLESKVAYDSPFEPASLRLEERTNVATFATTSFTTILDEQDLNEKIDASISVTAPVEGVDTTVDSSYLGRLSLNSSTMYQVLECTYQTEPRFCRPKPKFTASALSLLEKDAEKFAATYGEYFIAGYGERSYLRAVFTHRAEKQESLNQYAIDVTADMGMHSGGGKNYEEVEKVGEGLSSAEDEEETSAGKSPEASEKGKGGKKKTDSGHKKSHDEDEKKDTDTGADSGHESSREPASHQPHSKPGVLSASITSKMSSASERNSVRSTATSESSGYVGAATISVNGAYELFEKFGDFNANKPTKYIAFICHYKAINPKAIQPGNSFLQSASDHLTDTYKDFLKLHNQILASSDDDVKEFQDQSAALIKDFSEIHPGQSLEKELAGMQDRYKSISDGVKKIQLRRKFIKDASDTMNHQDHGWMRLIDMDRDGIPSSTPSSTPYMWGYGVTSREHIDELIRDEILTPEPLRWEVGFSLLGDTEQSVLYQNGIYHIVGYQVISNWKDDTNGWWLPLGADTTSVEVQFKRERTHGASWALQVFVVPKNKYHIVSP